MERTNSEDLRFNRKDSLESFKEASCLSSAELARRLGTSPQTGRRWTEGKARPNAEHMMALLDLAAGLDLGHLLNPQSLNTMAERTTP